MTYIYVIGTQRVNKVTRKKIFVLKRGFSHPGASRNSFWEKNFFESGSFNPFRAAVFFENRQFLLKILKISKCSNSVNFEGRRNLNPFLEFSDPFLLDAHAKTSRNHFFKLKTFVSCTLIQQIPICLLVIIPQNGYAIMTL